MRGEQSDHRVSLAARRLATLGAAIALACVPDHLRLLEPDRDNRPGSCQPKRHCHNT